MKWETPVRYRLNSGVTVEPVQFWGSSSFGFGSHLGRGLRSFGIAADSCMKSGFRPKVFAAEDVYGMFASSRLVRSSSRLTI